MKRRNALLKTVVPPVLVACVAYGVARVTTQWVNDDRAKAEAIGHSHQTREPDAGEILRSARNDLQGLARRRAMIALASTPSLAALERLRSSGVSNGDFPDEVVRACAARDPEATWRFLIGGSSSASDRHAEIVIAEWLKKDPDAIAEILRITPGFRDRRSIADAGMRFLLGGDETLANAALKQFDALLAIDPNLPNSLSPEGPQRDRLFARLLTLKPSAGRDALWSGIADQWLKKDWLATTSWVASLPSESRRAIEARFAESAFKSKNPNDAALVTWAVQWLSKSAPSGDVARLGPVYVEALAKTQPDAALEWATARLSGYPLTQAIGSIAATRFTTDPEGAKEMVAGLPPGGTQQAAAAKVTAAWAKTDPVAAVEWWLGFPHDNVGPMEFTGFSNQFSKAQLTAFRDYVLDPETPALPMRLASLAVNSENPASTVDLAEQSQGANRDRLLTYAINRWASQDPAAAAARLTGNPELVNRSRAKAITENWYKADRAASVDWAVSLPGDGTRDWVAGSLREKISKDPALNPKQKRELLAKLP